MAITERLKHPTIDQLTAYYRMREKLERDHPGRWVIVHDSKLVGADYASYDEAAEAARQMGLDALACLIRRVGPSAYILARGR